MEEIQLCGGARARAWVAGLDPNCKLLIKIKINRKQDSKRNPDWKIDCTCYVRAQVIAGDSLRVGIAPSDTKFSHKSGWNSKPAREWFRPLQQDRFKKRSKKVEGGRMDFRRKMRVYWVAWAAAVLIAGLAFAGVVAGQTPTGSIVG